MSSAAPARTSQSAASPEKTLALGFSESACVRNGLLQHSQSGAVGKFPQLRSIQVCRKSVSSMMMMMMMMMMMRVSLSLRVYLGKEPKKKRTQEPFARQARESGPRALSRSYPLFDTLVTPTLCDVFQHKTRIPDTVLDAGLARRWPTRRRRSRRGLHFRLAVTECRSSFNNSRN